MQSPTETHDDLLHWETEWGKHHGGRQRGIIMCMIAYTCALVALMALVLIVGNLDLGINAKALIMLSPLVPSYLFMVVVMLLYFRLRYALLITLTPPAIIGALVGLIWLVAH